MEIYRSQFMYLEYLEPYKLIETTVLASTRYMSKEQFMQESMNHLEMMLKWRPAKLINDWTDMQFTVTPELQEWTDRVILGPSLVLGLHKIAYVVSKDLFSQVSIEQAMEESEGSKLKVHYFEDRVIAKTWILH